MASTPSSSTCRTPIASTRASSSSGCSTACAPHAEQLGSAADLDAICDLVERGNGAARQVLVYEANSDLHELMVEIVAATAA